MNRRGSTLQSFRYAEKSPALLFSKKMKAGRLAGAHPDSVDEQRSAQSRAARFCSSILLLDAVYRLSFANRERGRPSNQRVLPVFHRSEMWRTMQGSQRPKVVRLFDPREIISWV